MASGSSFQGRPRSVVATTFAMAVVLTACSPSAGTPSSAPASASQSAAPSEVIPPGTVVVQLKDIVMYVSGTSAPAGEVTFIARAVGEPYEDHNLVVVRTELDAADLPTHDGSPIVDESQLDVVGRTQDLKGGESETLVLDLAPGHYVLICNIANHYNGMRVNFEVE